MSAPPTRSTDTPTPVDVMVVGAGPVGLVLAIDLARRGATVRIVDALPAPTTQSRAIVVHSRSLDQLAALGVIDDVMSRSIPAHGMRIHSGEKVVADVSFDAVPAVYPFSAALPQTDTEAVLTDRLAALGVHVHRATTLTGYRQDADGVDVSLATADGSLESVRARYLVGADGARSTVRRSMGQKLEGDFVGEDFLLGDVDGDHDYDRSVFHTFFAPGHATGLLFALPGDRVRVFAQLPPGTDPERTPTESWLQQALEERGIDLRIRASHWLTRLVLKHGQVPRYRDRRVFLAGDAAHIHSPAGGLGMNTGIQDATNLAWKLHLALQDTDSDRVLDSYHEERHPVAASVIAFTTRLSRIGTVSDPLAQHARNLLLHLGLAHEGIAGRVAGTIEQQDVRYRDSSVVSGAGRSVRPGDYLHLRDTPVARALQDDPGHHVIRIPGPGAGEPLPDWTVELSVTDADIEGLRAATGLVSGGMVIVRPDGYVGHIGSSSTAEAYGRLVGTV